MEEARLTTELWIKVHVRRCIAEGVPGIVARRGHRSGATGLLKLKQLERGCGVLPQVRDPDGRLGWMGALAGALVPEAEADAYIARAVARDPDLWVIEVESPSGSHPFEGKVL